MDFESLENYCINHQFDQQDFADLLNFLVIDIESNQYPEELTFDCIQIGYNLEKTAYEFKIETKSRLNLSELTESQKIRPICEIILLFFRKNPDHSMEKLLYKMQKDPKIIKEYKVLVSNYYSKKCFLNFKMFVLRIKQIYALFGCENIYNLTTENLFEGFKQNSDRNKVVPRKKLDLQLCNYCGLLSLEPMFNLNLCDCKFHKQCFESAIVSTVEYKELKEDFELCIPCATPHEHFNILDLEIIVEIEKERFTLSKPIVLMIKYYYLYWQEPANHYCSCENKDHFKVSKLNKRPVVLCNGKCSFCGERWEKECPKFKRALNWAY